ncbi:hypothetical protein V2P20_00625 [Methylobacter sp. Wu1]|uniref:hypothetical protein n=1 Tax=Methylobacter sp. Wu1 TaxID=3119359 RepID=UPI002F92306F
MDSLEKYYLLGIAIAAMAGVPGLSEAANGHFTHGNDAGSKTMAFAARPGSRSFQTAPRIISQGTILHDARLLQQRQLVESQADSRPENPSTIAPAG